MARPDLTFGQLRRRAEKQLNNKGIESAGLDARLLLMAAADCDAAALIMQAQEIVPGDVIDRLEHMMGRRLRDEPIAYILGHKAFWSLDFLVNEHVLIPRPETELVVEIGLEAVKNIQNPAILDVGTGSGAILISLLHERWDARGAGVDISQAALDVAAQNAENLDVADRIIFKRADFLNGVTGTFDLIVSNPPYITDEAMTQLPANVGQYEPKLALSGGVDGLDAYKTIINGASALLSPGGSLVFEIGYDQSAAVSGLLAANGFDQIRAQKDLAGHDRVVSGELSA